MTGDEFRPQKFGRFELARDLAPEGVVRRYLAIDPNNGQEVVLEVLPLRLASWSAREGAQAAMRLDHFAIAPVLAAGMQGDQFYVATRYMPGGSLKARWATGDLSYRTAVMVFERVGQALDHAHQAGVVHGNLSPSSIVFGANGMAYLSGFGLAGLNERAGDDQTAGLAGNPAYISPEQAQGQAADYRSDIYALGCILFEYMAGRPPFEAQTAIRLVMKHQLETAPDVRTFAQETPPMLAEALKRALAKDPAARYQRAGELVRDFARAINGQMRQARSGEGRLPRRETRATEGQLPRRATPVVAGSKAGPLVTAKPATEPKPSPATWRGCCMSRVLIAIGALVLLAVLIGGGIWLLGQFWG